MNQVPPLPLDSWNFTSRCIAACNEVEFMAPSQRWEIAFRCSSALRCFWESKVVTFGLLAPGFWGGPKMTDLAAESFCWNLMWKPKVWNKGRSECIFVFQALKRSLDEYLIRIWHFRFWRFLGFHIDEWITSNPIEILVFTTSPLAASLRRPGDGAFRVCLGRCLSWRRGSRRDHSWGRWTTTAGACSWIFSNWKDKMYFETVEFPNWQI